MLLHFIRAIFVIVILAALFMGITNKAEDPTVTQGEIWVVFIGGLVLAIAVLFIDWVLPKRSLSALAGIFF